MKVTTSLLSVLAILIFLSIVFVYFSMTQLIVPIEEPFRIELKHKFQSYKSIVYYYFTPRITTIRATVWRKNKVSLEIKGYDIDTAFKEPRLNQLHLNDCYYPKSWQNKSYPTCLEVHSINLKADVHYIAHGGRRDVWKVLAKNSSSDEVVLKTLRFNGPKDEANKFPSMIESHRIDALIMERLTGSDRIANVFGFCGNSALNEVGYNNLYKFIDSTDKNQTDFKMHLKFALEAALALSDVHNFESESKESLIVHGDIRPWNFLVSSSKTSVILNDFNAGILLMKNQSSSSNCFLSRKGCALNQSPEECLRLPIRNEKIDVYAFGHVLYFLITGMKPYDNIFDSRNWTRHSFESGSRPYSLPIEIENEGKTNPFIRAMAIAMDKCYTLDPNLRPSAGEVAHILQTAYFALQ